MKNSIINILNQNELEITKENHWLIKKLMNLYPNKIEKFELQRRLLSRFTGYNIKTCRDCAIAMDNSGYQGHDTLGFLDTLRIKKIVERCFEGDEECYVLTKEAYDKLHNK